MANQFANGARSTLASGIDTDDLSATLDDGASFPASGDFRCLIFDPDDMSTAEIVKVTARATDVLTIERAAEAYNGSQTAFSHSAGETVALVIAASQLTHLQPPTTIECAAQCAISASSTTTNFENSGSVGGAGGSFAIKNLMQFSLSGISSVKRATLQVVFLDYNNCLAINEGLHQWLRVDRAVRTNIVYSQATWNVYSTGNNWGTAGANNTTTDVTRDFVSFLGPFSSNTRIFTMTGATVQYEKLDVTEMVQEALANSLSNIDIIFYASATGGQNAMTIASRTNGTAARRPKLIWF